MQLYKFLFPNENICDEKEMYYRGCGVIQDNNKIIFKLDGKLSSSTYFNSISLDKWYENTTAKNISVNIRLKGHFIVSLCTVEIIEGKIIENEETKKEFYSNNFDFIQLEFKSSSGIGYFKLTSLEDNSVFDSAEYTANVNQDYVNHINIAIGICTFKREEFITANLQRLLEAITNKESVLYNTLDVYVSDNGQTLPLDLNNEHIKIFYNPNYGGAGGFTRTLIEAKKSGKNYTNFIFLDDDIVLDTHAIEKNATFLSIIKQEKQKSVIGGAMFSMDNRYLQFESAAKWKDAGFKFNRRDVDLRQLNNVILNEQKYDVNYNAWCYCCIPFEVITDSNLPLPIFFHMDDVEYGLRNALPIITLNGINVWHLYKKGMVPAKNVYYDTRNKLIMLAGLNPPEAIKVAWNYFSSFTLEALKFHYAKTINAYKGILDFCKGFDWLKNTNTLEIHQSLFNNVSWENISNENLLDKAQFSNSDIRTRKSKLTTLFNQLLPHLQTKIIYDDNSYTDTRNCNKIVVVNRQEKKSITYKKNLLLAAKCLVKRRVVLHSLKKKLPKVIEEYNQRINEIQSISFWEKYLELPIEKKVYKVLFVASDNDSTSGAFRSMTVLARLMKEKYGLQTKVLLPRKGDGVQLLKENGIEHTIIPSEDWIVKLSDDSYTVAQKQKRIKEINKKGLKKITRFLKEENFDLIHINTTYSYVAALAAQKLNIPIVWHLREFLEEDQHRKIIDKNFGYSLINKSSKIIAISDSIFDKYKFVFDKNKLLRIYNGIDPNQFLCLDHKIFINEIPRFICVGVIDEYKGQGELIEALGKYKQRYNRPFKLTLVGNNKGAYMKVINQLIEQYGIRNEVVFLGRRNDVYNMLKDTDVTFVCSKAEAFGRVTVEAMLAGSLVIGADNAGTKELINNNNDGLLYTSGNSDELCECINYALNNIETMRNFAIAGQKKCLNMFTAEKNCANVYEQYQKIWEGEKQ